MKTKLFLLLLFWNGVVWGQQTSALIGKKSADKTKTQKLLPKEAIAKQAQSEIKVCRNKITQEIVYNFSTGMFEKSVIKPCQKVPIVLKVSNINTYFYDIQIQSKDVNINSDALYETPVDTRKTTIIKIDTTAVLSILDTKVVNSIPGISTQTKLKTKGNALEEISKKENALTLSKSALLQSELKLTNFQDKKNEIESIAVLKRKLNDLESLPDSLKGKNAQILSETQNRLTDLEKKHEKPDIKNVNDNIEAQKQDLETKRLDVYIANSQLERELLNLKDKNDIFTKLNEGTFKLNSKYYELDTEFIEVLKIAGAYNNFIYKIYRPGMNQQEYIKLKYPNEKFETIAILDFDKLSEYYSRLKTFNTAYSDFQKLYNQTKINNSLLIQNQSEDLVFVKTTLEEEYNRIKNVTDQMLKKVESMNLSSKLNAIEIYNRELQNDQTFEYVSDPIQGLGDYVEFDVTIKPKTEFKEIFAKNQNRRFKYSEYLRGGIRYDFSVGTVFDFVNKDEVYENRNDTITKTSNNKYYPTLAGLFHVSLRSNSLCSLGFSLGASLNIAEFDINSLFIGPSLLIGKKEKIIFTSGLSFRKTKQLEKGHYDGESIVGESNIEDYLTNNFRLGIFFGISYNLTKKQKSSLKIANNGQ